MKRTAGKWERRLATFIASVAYVGYAPVAPGTVGTLAAVAVYWWFLPNDAWLCLAAVLAAAAGVWAAGVAEAAWRQKDPGRICVDEFAAYFVAVAFLPKTLVYASAAFVLFRALDVFKPFPAGRSQRLRGGWGVMADDLIVALYTNLILQGARLVIRLGHIGGNTFG